jgi:hypothetical protein
MVRKNFIAREKHPIKKIIGYKTQQVTSVI